ncbi:YdeI/OmpD-associated family protein [Pseudanabaena sp. FACHB-1998]|nr:YdeI/OmpD-associated family protein [Pseudanabaena sp. FACHB-1998]
MSIGLRTFCPYLSTSVGVYLYSTLFSFHVTSDLSRTDKRNLLQWITLAKREETRQKRIREIVFSAENKRKPKQF